jgi:hypothetical protein
MRYGRPTVRWLSTALALFYFLAFTFFTKGVAAQGIVPGFNKPGVLVSDASIPSESTLRFNQPIWSGPCIVVNDVTKSGSGMALGSGVLVSDGPLVIDCVVVIESNADEPRTIYEFSCWSAKPY